MKRILNCLILFVVAIVIAIVPNTSRAESGMYIGLYGGYTTGMDASWEYSNRDFDLDIDDTWTAGIKIGYSHPKMKYFAAELEYSYLEPELNNTIITRSGADLISFDSGNSKLHNFMLNIIAKYPEGRIHPYFGFGLGASYVDIDSQVSSSIAGVTASANISEHDTSFAWQAMAGIDFDIVKNLSIDLGYRYFYTKPDINDSELEIKTGIVTAGLKFRF
jgi:opacity protein-like surface antigen